MTLAIYRTAIDELVPDQQQLTGTTQKDRAIGQALLEHSRHKPLEIVEDLSGDGGYAYALSGLASWDEDFSSVLAVEYPVDDTDEDQQILNPGEDWKVYKAPTGRELHFLFDKPAATETFRVTYTAPHAVDADSSTVASMDDAAVQTLAAAKFCRILAARNAANEDSSMAADSVDHVSKRREYEAAAKSYEAEYYDHIGAKPKSAPKPGCAFADWDVDNQDGSDRLTHGRRRR